MIAIAAFALFYRNYLQNALSTEEWDHQQSAPVTDQAQQESQASTPATISDPIIVDSPPPPPPPPPPPADPIIAAFVDNLTVSLVRDNPGNESIVIRRVRHTPGSIIDDDLNIRFVGIERSRKEIIFEDERGARYFLYY
ncbi:MAG: hypothetical protein LR015_13945 [Verrucomicrobia bacterium]|nr:hypothetical protein [Verrucomicrobiota bacterium]